MESIGLRLMPQLSGLPIYTWLSRGSLVCGSGRMSLSLTYGESTNLEFVSIISKILLTGSSARLAVPPPSPFFAPGLFRRPAGAGAASASGRLGGERGEEGGHRLPGLEAPLLALPACARAHGAHGHAPPRCTRQCVAACMTWRSRLTGHWQSG